MAPEPPSPSASAALLPFLSARSRRGSLASLKSTKGEIDKDVLAQALDDIHTSASKSETLTSFHDYDGGAPRSGAKELVSGGVTGLYDKMKRSLTAATPVKENKSRPKSPASKESGDTDSIRSNGSRKGLGLGIKKPAADAASIVSNASASASPVVTNSTGKPMEGKALEQKLEAQKRLPEHVDDRPALHVDTKVDAKHSASDSKSKLSAKQEFPTPKDFERARNALVDDDRSGSATQALARVLSNHETQVGDSSRKPRSLNIPVDHEEAIDDSEPGLDAMRSPSAPPPRAIGSTLDPNDRADSTSATQVNGRLDRPQLLRVGASHLPGYEPSRASSTDGGDAASISSSQVTGKKAALERSPNLNAALQRRRADMAPPPRPSEPLEYVPPSLKRRVISKTFWMKDENAKDCFSCGQPFSTFRRKHHCRTCGQIFDAKCTDLVPGKPFGQPGTIRLCKPCEAMIYGSDDDSTVFSDDASEFVRSPIMRRSFNEDDDLHGRMDGIDDDDDDLAEIMTPSIGIPASRRNREAKRRSAVIEFDAGPTLPRPTSSHSLISLGRRPRSSSHRRHQSRAQTVRGLRAAAEERGPFHPGSVEDSDKKSALPAFHNDNIIDPDLAPYLSDEGSDEEDQPSLFTAMGELSNASPGDRDRTGYTGMFASAMKKGRSRMGTASSGKATKGDDALIQATKHLPKLSRNRNLSTGSMSASIGRPSPRRSRSNNLLKSAVEGDYAEKSAGSPALASSGPGTKLVRSCSMRGRDAPPIELNHASLSHVHKLLSQLLRDSEIQSASAWERALVPILLRCTDDVEPNVQLGDDMDIRHYIKLKKVPGGRPVDTSYISGVVFSKNIALKSMARSIPFPRIAIVTFAIEYARPQAHFMSLEPVIAQEQEFLKNLVGRISALRPHLLLVQKHVSGLALDLLDKAGITVVYNIKASVLAAVARVTQTTMIKSVDKLAIDPSHLGQCDSFEVKTFVHDRKRKSYIYLSGCQPDLGCTIVLRGTDTQTLRKIKRITEFMCYVAYNLRLETNLLRDEFVSIPSTAHDQLRAPDSMRDKNSKGLHIQFGHDHGESLGDTKARAGSDSDTPSMYETMEETSRSRILSASPFVVFMQPYILTQLRESERRLTAYKQLRDQYAAADKEGDEDEKAGDEEFELVKPEMVHAPASKDQPKAVREYLHAVHEAQFEKTMHTYETQKRLMESFMNASTNPFDPFSHQKIVVLHSTVSTLNSAPCVGPDLLGIGFYAGYNHVEPNYEEDCTLGQYIEDLCISANSTCKECGKRTYDHHRQYVHGYGQLSVSVLRQPAKMRGYEKTILMWATCRICKQETTVTPMSDNTWKYSFAKYLELSFWSSPLRPRAGVCEHDIHKDFLRYFGFEDLVVRLQYDPVEIYDVIVPRSTITWKVESDLKVKNDQFLAFAGRLNNFTDSIKKRLDSIHVDTLEEKKAMEANDLLDELRQRAQDEHEELLQKLQEKYAVSRYYEMIPLNRALRFMDEKALAWDDIFEAFERDYFPSETDIRKLATLQLKNMFLESQPATSTVTSDVSDDEDGPEMKSPRRRPIKRGHTDNELRSEMAHDVLSSTVEQHRASIISEEENQGEETLGDGLTRKISPREEQEQAVQRKDVKHLDLAVPQISPDNEPKTERSSSGEESKQSSRPATREGQPSEEPFATQTKPLSSGLLERIEQIRGTKGGAPLEQESAESKIPRLADLKKQDASPAAKPPPLLRALSSPSSPTHTPKRSADLTSEHSIDSVASGTSEQEAQHHEKRLGDRLGMSRLASKVGKVAPSLIPRSIPIKVEDANSTKVSALAKHFEQMSREFEKERLKERRQRALLSRQARANPLASSRPVVEVYRNATEAVGERNPESRQADQGKKERPAERNATAESAALAQLPSSDEMPQETSRDQAASSPAPKRELSRANSDTEGEIEGGELETTEGRSRDISDPISGVSSSGLVLPNSIPELELHPELSIPEHRKNVWFNYLAEFWSKRSSSGWANLEYPLHATEHVFEDSDIIVREDEPSSVIALSLACADYQAKVQEFRSHPKRHTKQPSQNDQKASSSSVQHDTQQKAIEASLLSDTGTHMKYSFAHGQVKASCKIFYAESFDALRRRCGVAERFVESLSRCLKFDSKGGKTKSLFLKTLDNRFYIKSLQEVELKAFTKFAPDYFAFMSYTLFHGVPSVIAKMFGLFQVSIKNPATGMDFSCYLLVMENLFYERNPTRRFDLKGSMRNRKIESTGQPDEVLLDENLVETIFESPLFVREHARKLLQASVWNDTMWLCKQNVMDYSLMAGFDDERKELIVGIIDCIRTYTWDKKLESWIKDRGKNKPTITSPKDYRNRFRVSMMQYVLVSPTAWHQFQVQMAAPKTLKEKEDKEEVAETTETEREGEGKTTAGV